MSDVKPISQEDFVKTVHPARPDWDYYLPGENREVMEQLSQRPIFRESCERPCTTTLTLLPKSLVQARTGIGYYMINIDGYRTINAFVISDPLNSSTQRGFTLELSFSLNDFVYGVGVVGETSFFYNFDDYFNSGSSAQPTIRCQTSDLTTTGGLVQIGGVDYTHILRAPVLGPYVRASVFNQDAAAHQVEVRAYLST